MYAHIEAAIFDMDGTLYKFDTPNFSSSLLGRSVMESFDEILQGKANYQSLAEAEKRTGIPLSLQVANLLGKTREEIFRLTWGKIEPEGIISDYDVSTKVVREIHECGIPLHLVTAAPRVWSEKVLGFLGIRESFHSITTAENISGSKRHSFKNIIENYGYAAGKVISVGDQENTDIIPAIELGMLTLHVSGPKDTISLISHITADA